MIQPVLPMMKPPNLSVDQDHSEPTRYQMAFVMIKVTIGLYSARNPKDANGMVVPDEHGLCAPNARFTCAPHEQIAFWTIMAYN